MIIFTVTNQNSGQIYVGTTRNDLCCQWEKMVCAAKNNLDFPLYREIRKYGRGSFIVEEYDYADSREELIGLEEDALLTLNAKSLRGYKVGTTKIKSKIKKEGKSKNYSGTSVESQIASMLRVIDAEEQLSFDPEEILCDFDDVPLNSETNFDVNFNEKSERQCQTKDENVNDVGFIEDKCHGTLQKCDSANQVSQNRSRKTISSVQKMVKVQVHQTQETVVVSQKDNDSDVQRSGLKTSTKVNSTIHCSLSDSKIDRVEYQESFHRNRQVVQQFNHNKHHSESLSRRQNALQKALDAVLAGTQVDTHLQELVADDAQVVANSQYSDEIMLENSQNLMENTALSDTLESVNEIKSRLRDAIVRSRLERRKGDIDRNNTEKLKIEQLFFELEDRLSSSLSF